MPTTITEAPHDWVARNGHLGTAQSLLEAGAAVDALTKFGDTALELALLFGESEVAEEFFRNHEPARRSLSRSDQHAAALRQP